MPYDEDGNLIDEHGNLIPGSGEPREDQETPEEEDFVKEFQEGDNFKEEAKEEQSEADLDDELKADLKKSLEEAPQGPEKKVKIDTLKTKSPLPIIGAAVLVILVLVAVGYILYLQQKGADPKKLTIVFTLSPPGTEVTVDEQKVVPVTRKDGQLGITGLEAGKHTLAFRNKGHKPLTMKDVVVSEKTATLLGSVKLEKYPSGSITVKIEPADVKLYIDGAEVKVVKLDDGSLQVTGVPEGKHSLRVEKKDLESWKKDDIQMAKDDCLELDPLTLKQRIWKPMEIDVSPVAVSVFVDRKKVGTTVNAKNIVITDSLDPGKYRLDIFADGYESWSMKEVEVYPDLSTTVGPVRLSLLKSGKIILDSEEKPDVELDGKKVEPVLRSDGRYEVDKVKPGTHSLKVSREGFHELIWDKIAMPKDRPLELANIPWKQMKGKTVILSTDPGEVKIYLENELKGTTPPIPGTSFVITDLKAERYTLRAEKEGYSTWKDESVIVEDDKPTIMPLIALTKPSSLKITGTPEEVEARIEGREGTVTAPGTLSDLAPGTYKITLKKKGFKDKVMMATVAAGKETEITYKLEKKK
ncbi:MAG: PEGA domain-containing protein [Candidatus Eremiobacteraeota bacterium]|nr:PEGA domain-containing protein [Candidatus Eremiobacteraeota bacterium]